MFCFPFLVLGAVQLSKSGLSTWQIKTLNHSPPKQNRRNEKAAQGTTTAEDRFESAEELISAVRDLLESGIKHVQLSSNKVILPSHFCAAVLSSELLLNTYKCECGTIVKQIYIYMYI